MTMRKRARMLARGTGKRPPSLTHKRGGDGEAYGEGSTVRRRLGKRRLPQRLARGPSARSGRGASAAARRKPGPKPGPKPGTPSWRRFRYTPEMIEDCRRRYEETPESAVSISRDYGVHDVTIRRLARDLGWVRFPSQLRGVPDDLRLRRRLEAMAATMQLTPTPSLQEPAPGRGGKREAVPRSSGSGGEQEAVPESASLDDAHAAVIRQGIGEVEARIAQVTERRLRNHPQTMAEARDDARILANLTASLRALKAMLGGAPAITGSSYDDLPADLDQFRLELARRIDALFQSEPDRGTDAAADAARGDQA